MGILMNSGDIVETERCKSVERRDDDGRNRKNPHVTSLSLKE